MALIAAWFARSVVGRWIVGALAILAGAALYLNRRDERIRREQRDAAELVRRRAEAETRRRMDRADIGSGDVDDDLEWLRLRATSGRREPPLVLGDR